MPKAWRSIALGLALLGLAHAASAQMRPFVLLEKAGTDKRIRYYPGDEIRFILDGDDTIHSGVVTALNDSVFFLDQDVSVKYQDVEAIVTERSGIIRAIGATAFYAIPPILLFTAANNAFNTGRTPLIDDSAIGIAGVFGAVGLASLFISHNKKYKLKNRWRLLAVIH